ncbi:MAG: TraB/GumN family protein [Salibacteraceae bacterium]
MKKASVYKKLFLFGLSIGFGIMMGKAIAVLHSNAQPKVAACPQETAPQLSNSLLWKIEGKGLENPSYLFGTIHFFPESSFFLPRATAEVLDGVERITFELDLTNPNLQKELLQYTNMEEGQSLDKLYTEEEYQKIDEWIKSTVGVGVEKFNTWQPMLLTTFILPRLLDEPAVSYEMKLLQEAQSRELEITGLETVKEQCMAMANIPPKEQAEMLKEIVYDETKMQALFKQMIDLYAEQNITDLYDLLEESSGGAAMTKPLVIERNQNWVDRIQNQYAEKPTFFAVGAGHLAGTKGLIALLRAEGYSVSAVE